MVGVWQLRGDGGQHHRPQVLYLYLARGLVHLRVHVHVRARSLQRHMLSQTAEQTFCINAFVWRPFLQTDSPLFENIVDSLA